MVKLLIIANDAPYGGEKTWNALRLAGASASAEIGMQVRVFLMGDAVSAAKKGQVTPEGFYNFEKILVDLAAKGVEVKCCGTCLKSRGLKEEDLVEGAQRGTLMILANWVKESDRIVTF